MPAARVEALCPMGCGPTIFVDSGGHLTCSSVSCPDPTRLDQVVNNERNVEHVVYYGETSFTVQHPLREREHDMDKCPLHVWISENGPTEEVGTYLVHERREHDPTSESFRSDASPWVFDPIEGKLT